jgi:HK97 family phage prohead protease
MKDQLKNISAELAATIVERFQSPEVRELIAQTKAASDEETGTFEVVITTENLDRYREVIKLEGWELGHYRNNPVVLWGHDHNRLIGMATSIEIADGKMIAKGRFAPTAEGQEFRKLYDMGFLKATSVGFIEKEREGNLITKAELLEFSFVTVPANPYALSLSMEKGLSVNELVTKGILFVEKEVEEETVVETVPESETVAEEVPEVPANDNEPVTQEERNFSTKQLSPVIDSLKAAVVALEALGVKAEEPEGDADDEVDDEEEAAVKNYMQLKTAIQSLDTSMGEVLAEMRKAGGAR